MSRCIGCGVKLQSDNPNDDGYVENLEYNLCRRCFLIKNYNRYDVSNRTNEDYLKIINKIKDNDTVVYVSSLLTLNLDYISKFKNVILVLTKRDILPKSVKDNKIIKYIKEKYNNISEIMIVSAIKKYNLDSLYNLLYKYKKNDIYFVGATNSGKSTLINEMVKSYGNGETNITVSNYPSTTLDVINIKLSDMIIKDTPGLVNKDSIINYLSSEDVNRINSKKEIKPITIQINGSGAILIDKLFRVEYDTTESSMTFYVSNNLLVESISLKNQRLSDLDFKEFNITQNQDLVIEDIGFIKITKATKIKVFCNNSVYMYLRDKLI